MKSSEEIVKIMEADLKYFKMLMKQPQTNDAKHKIDGCIKTYEYLLDWIKSEKGQKDE